MVKDTIFALSSGQGKSGVAVVRISGPAATAAVKDCELKPRATTLLDWYGIDKLIAIYFPAPNSFTGEDIVELQCHGSYAVIQAIFEKLRGFGFRMAERGEYARRAFENGKMDLTEVEGLRALIDAKTERQRLRALRSMTGRDSKQLEDWRGEMIKLAALSAARMDYAADELPTNIDERINFRLDRFWREIDDALTWSETGRLIESGCSVVLAGKTNVGKSSLFNRMIGEGRAIVSDIPGTTRDIVSAELDLDGFLVRLSDTAGLRESNDEIEKIGIEKTLSAMRDGDIVINVFDSNDAEIIEKDHTLNVINKADLIEKKTKPHAIYVSAKTGEGIDDLMNAIKAEVKNRIDEGDSDLAITERARGHLETAESELKLASKAAPELQAEHIMAAADEIRQILGLIGLDEIYDSVFEQLCLGK